MALGFLNLELDRELEAEALDALGLQREAHLDFREFVSLVKRVEPFRGRGGRGVGARSLSAHTHAQRRPRLDRSVSCHHLGERGACALLRSLLTSPLSSLLSPSLPPIIPSPYHPSIHSV